MAELWERIEQQTKSWREVVLPGIAIIGLVLVARLSGFLQFQELMAFDHFMRLRPAEAMDTRVVIVGIDENDIKTISSYPVPDRELATALLKLQAYHPRVIGLNLFKDLTGTPGRAELGEVLSKSPNLVGIEKTLNSQESFNIQPPPELPPERVGFVDFIVDSDGKLRRSILKSRTWDSELKYSLPMRLAQLYLQAEGITLKNDSLARDPIQFGSTRLTRFRRNFGGYVRADANGNQILINFRAHQQPFRTISLTDVINGKVNPSWIEDRIVIIGMTAASIGESFITSAVKHTLFTFASNGSDSSNQLIYGTEVQAHVTSQIISTVLDRRPNLRAWPDGWEYVWIVSWGLLGIGLGLNFQSPWKTLLSIGVASIGLTVISYGSLLISWWVPCVPTLLALCGAGLTTAFVDRDLKSLLDQRSQTLERMFEAIHNGPLQDLAVVLRTIGEEDIPTQPLRSQLQKVNQDLRDVYNSMRQEMLEQRNRLYLEGNLCLDLETPLDELLYQVYELTLNRKFQCFTTIRTYIRPHFQPLGKCRLSTDQKRSLCLFLQEALCNVGKHAVGATYLDIVCTQEKGWYSLQILDNGVGISSQLEFLGRGRGTTQAQELARQLRGRFQRLPNSPQGTICLLTWPVFRTWFWLSWFR
ncbi:MAG TPA: histidine kinase [Cyanobacteria bacterium UBA8803]|nr:histidine kinase [Cyanobacteria bacterium UBA9273]HBL58074.1 histidine kinase [Cyanobacteria bacterium UBA8803]